MAYTRSWDNTDPANTDEAKYGAQEIREFKEDVEERFESIVADIDTDPLTIALQELGADPAAVANKFLLYAKDVGGVTVLYRRNSSGISVLEFASGTKMLFYQDTAPTGWTIQNTLDDKLVFITKGSVAGGQTGGGEHATGSWTLSGFDANVGAHQLTIAEMPAHAHKVYYNSQSFPGSSTSHLASTPGLSVNSESVGGDGTHVHTSPSQDGTWRPAAYCCIIAAKD